MRYNCFECRKFWKPLMRYFIGIDKEIQYIKLYCPSCKKMDRKGMEW